MMQRRNIPPRNRRRTAFTLVELVVSMGIMSILFGGTISAILIASHALPDGQSPAEQILCGGEVVDAIAGDLFYATAITESTATAVTFAVPDRGHGAAGPETIRYEWLGIPGNPLTREYNGGVKLTVAAGVQDFALSYSVTAAKLDIKKGALEGSERVLLQQDGTNSGTPSDFAIQTGFLCAESFQPTLPGTATSWRITRVKFMAAPDAVLDGKLTIELVQPDMSGKPGLTVIDKVNYLGESTLVAKQWHEVAFTKAGGLSPSSGVFIKFSGKGTGTVALLRIGTGGVAAAGTAFFADSGTGTWVESSTTNIWLSVYGTVTGPDQGAAPTVSTLHSVGVALQTAASAATRVETQVMTVNAPDVRGL